MHVFTLRYVLMFILYADTSLNMDSYVLTYLLTTLLPLQSVSPPPVMFKPHNSYSETENLCVIQRYNQASNSELLKYPYTITYSRI
jgi:hypothetical protein